MSRTIECSRVGGEKSERLPMAIVGPAVRQANLRVRRARVTSAHALWMLGAVLDLTATYSRLVVRLSPRELGAAAGIGDPRNARRALRELAEVDAIRITERSRSRGWRIEIPRAADPRDDDSQRATSAIKAPASPAPGAARSWPIETPHAATDSSISNCRGGPGETAATVQWEEERGLVGPRGRGLTRPPIARARVNRAVRDLVVRDLAARPSSIKKKVSPLLLAAIEAVGAAPSPALLGRLVDEHEASPEGVLALVAVASAKRSPAGWLCRALDDGAAADRQRLFDAEAQAASQLAERAWRCRLEANARQERLSGLGDPFHAACSAMRGLLNVVESDEEAVRLLLVDIAAEEGEAVLLAFVCSELGWEAAELASRLLAAE
jgi:hypothetical protein